MFVEDVLKGKIIFIFSLFDDEQLEFKEFFEDVVGILQFLKSWIDGLVEIIVKDVEVLLNCKDVV